MRPIRFLFYMAIFALAACKQESRSVENGEVVNVYTACYQKTDEQLFSIFEKSTGIKVNIMYGSPGDLMKKLQQETQPEADILLLQGVCYLQQAETNNLLQPLPGQFSISYSSPFRETTTSWYPLTYDPIVISYVRDSSITQPPATYAELTQEKWRGKLLPADRTLLCTLTAAMLADRGEEATAQWLRQYKKNVAPQAVTAEVFQYMIKDSASIALVKVSAYVASSRSSNIGLIFPDQAGSGTYAFVQGVSLVENAPNPSHARQLLSFLLRTEIQRLYAQARREYPAGTEVQTSPALQKLGDFQLNTPSADTSEQYCNRAALLLEEMGF